MLLFEKNVFCYQIDWIKKLNKVKFDTKDTDRGYLTETNLHPNKKTVIFNFENKITIKKGPRKRDRADFEENGRFHMKALYWNRPFRKGPENLEKKASRGNMNRNIGH